MKKPKIIVLNFILVSIVILNLLFLGVPISTGSKGYGESRTISNLRPSQSVPDSWAKTYGGSGNDYPKSIIENNGTYTLVGSTNSLGGNPRAWILGLDRYGNVISSKTYDSDGAVAITNTSGGGHAILGASSGDLWIMKLNSTNSVVWQKTLGGTANELPISIASTSDDGYIVAAGSNSFSGNSNVYEILVLKLDSSGNLIWQKKYAPGGASTIIPVSAGGYILTGGESGSFLVFRLDDNGGILWQKLYGELFGRAEGVRETSDGGFIVAGHRESPGNAWVIKLDSSGAVTWQKTYGSSGNDLIQSIALDGSGGYIMAGSTNGFNAGGGWLVRLDSTGNILWQKTFGASSSEGIVAVTATSDGGFAAVGNTTSFGAGATDFWVLKLDSYGNMSNICSMGVATSATPTASSQLTVDSTASGSNTNITPTASNAGITNFAPQVSTQCNPFSYYLPFVVSDAVSP